MEEQTRKRNGIRLQRLNRGLLLVTVVLGVALALLAFSVNRSFQQLDNATEQYIRARKDTSDMLEGSDYLTDRVRTFIVTGDISAAEDFYREIEQTKRRDNAVLSMETYLSDPVIAGYLSDALNASNELAEIETYAFALAAKGYGTDPEALPVAVKAITLSAEDEALSTEEKIEKARTLVFDETYQTHKSKIRESVARCEDELVGETQKVQESSATHLGRAITALTILIVIVVLVVIAMVILSIRLLLRPLGNLITAIQQDRPCEEQGAYELRYVMNTYNSALEQNRMSQEELAYNASHDTLTGVYNRGVFEKAKEKNRGRAQAVFIFDVDHFKQFNDTYGHDLGDRVLKKVASAISGNFREEDYVCRYGGDEFTVLMVHVTSAMRSLVERKIETIRSICRDTSDGLPEITLSIGVAFSDRPDPTDDILKDADTALYSTKERGKNGYTFYGDKMTAEEDHMLSIATLSSYGANVEEGLSRCMNNEAFYLRLVKMASEDEHFDKLEQALSDRDLDAAFHAAHALKGVLANLAITPLLEPVAQMTELLRARTDMDYGPLLDRVVKGHEDLRELCRD